MKRKKKSWWLVAAAIILLVFTGICDYNNISRPLAAVVSYDAGASYAMGVSMPFIVMRYILLLLFLICISCIFCQNNLHTAALERIAYYDELCCCPTLARFKLTAQQFVDRHPNDKVLMVKFDIAEFKVLNQILGAKTGDLVLIRIGEALWQITAPGCFCRTHDDEFLALLVCGTSEELAVIRERFLNLLYHLMGDDFSYRFQVISGHYFMSFENCRSVAEGIEKANIAHCKAKELGVEVCVYDESFVRQALWKKQVECRLEDALVNKEFQVYLQAQYTLSDERVASAEALARWLWEPGRLLAPSEFVPILEDSKLIVKVDFYIWEQVCRQLREWMESGIPLFEISVNFSRKHLANPCFVENLCRIADRYRIPHRFLVVELTETAIMENEKMLLTVIEQLHLQGFLLSMDDFGTGYSSLGLLKNMPVDILKIDRSFFTDERYCTRAEVLLSGVMEIARQLGIITVAEGVEEQAHIDRLRELGCDKVQGYYYERPVPMETFWPR